MNWRKLLLSPQGRIGRKSFWIWIAVSYAVAIVAGVVDVTIFGLEAEASPISAVAALASIYPSFCVSVKRLHDTNRSGWWLAAPVAVFAPALVAAAPFLSTADGAGAAGLAIVVAIAAIVFAVLSVMLFVWTGFFKGGNSPNKYGEPNSGDRETEPLVEVFT